MGHLAGPAETKYNFVNFLSRYRSPVLPSPKCRWEVDANTRLSHASSKLFVAAVAALRLPIIVIIWPSRVLIIPWSSFPSLNSVRWLVMIKYIYRIYSYSSPDWATATKRTKVLRMVYDVRTLADDIVQRTLDTLAWSKVSVSVRWRVTDNTLAPTQHTSQIKSFNWDMYAFKVSEFWKFVSKH